MPRPRPATLVLYSANLVAEASGTLELKTYPAIITSVEDSGDVNLTVFFDHHVHGANLMGHPTSVPYSREAKMHTWQYVDDVYPIERARRSK